ncbi:MULTISPECIES: class I SAM-dependent methyltransferase [Lysinibacillus]|uniref:Class I SAM-dependent methyltransferase n=3 Tax=Lysinibacillus TaxID=400634 RepID=A0A4U2ZCL5_9BACI|nr:MULTISPECIES: class I SAM-dependent methyltransferase [Lysinibacillus]AHN22900.1 N-6 DNA methylase [Lysinibacillus varians]MCS1380666.1 class I SAM-dependent methyltransferase [Lysinibacillus sphaericus]TKI49757.1 class I SAM-dependent methyltransferase [Lysinibacillus tabacifolii]TKI65492.1 class I SAM-dependent methyltransferase [Lysinibacillus varians]TKI72207.1 class I SAM-dependent methyltransferase [Lysinibacillus mangiferihumi]
MEKIEKLFGMLNEHAEKIEKEQDATLLEGVLDGLEAWLDGEVDFSQQGATKEDVRKSIQIAILKGMRKGSQPNHQMTPDTLGLLVGYFVEQIFADRLEKEKLTIMDPAVGTGNLLLTVMNLLDGKLEASGVEVDELLIQLAAATADLTEQPVSLYRQDALQDLLVDPVDAIVCDLPVGYYPNEEVALDYELCASEGMSYAHHLFIEQSINYTKDGGYLFFLAPTHLFESEQSKQLHKYIQKHAWIQAIIQLPDTMFANKALEKSIVILQKQGEAFKAPKEVLLAKVPNMQNKQALALFFEKVKMWQEGK